MKTKKGSFQEMFFSKCENVFFVKSFSPVKVCFTWVFTTYHDPQPLSHFSSKVMAAATYLKQFLVSWLLVFKRMGWESAAAQFSPPCSRMWRPSLVTDVQTSYMSSPWKFANFTFNIGFKVWRVALICHLHLSLLTKDWCRSLVGWRPDVAATPVNVTGTVPSQKVKAWR